MVDAGNDRLIIKRMLAAALGVALAITFAASRGESVGLRSEDPAPAEESSVESTERVDPCAGTVALDDGQVDSGYGFVPSATVGGYLQPFSVRDLGGRYLTKVCICWLKTRDDTDIDFEIIVHEDIGGRPSAEPMAVVPASAKGVASSVAEAGAMVAVDVPNVLLPEDTVFIGARWNPSEERFLFVCNDQTPESPRTPAFSFEDRAPSWTSVASSKDPIFKPHRAIMVRPGASVKPVELSPAASAAPVPGTP